MALQIDIEIGNTGLLAKHHVITDVKIDKKRKRVFISTEGYKNKSARLDDKDPVIGAEQRFVLVKSDYRDFIQGTPDAEDETAPLSDNLFKRAYQVLKSMPEFAGATDA